MAEHCVGREPTFIPSRTDRLFSLNQTTQTEVLLDDNICHVLVHDFCQAWNKYAYHLQQP